VPTKFIDITTPQITALIMKNYAALKEALQMLNKLIHIARNLLVTTNPEVPQDLSAAVSFDHEVYEAICLCVNVTSKGIDGEMPEDDASRVKLNEITELCKQLQYYHPPSGGWQYYGTNTSSLNRQKGTRDISAAGSQLDRQE
jgi:palmitoyltransferase